MYKVLIIDDEAPARIAISRLGHWADYHITELYQETNGAAALKTMREIKPQIVFVDMQMPVAWNFWKRLPMNLGIPVLL